MKLNFLSQDKNHTFVGFFFAEFTVVFLGKKVSPVSEIPRVPLQQRLEAGRDGAFVNQKQTFQPTVSKFIARHRVLLQTSMMRPYKRREEVRKKKGKMKANHATTLRTG